MMIFRSYFLHENRGFAHYIDNVVAKLSTPAFMSVLKVFMTQVTAFLIRARKEKETCEDQVWSLL